MGPTGGIVEALGSTQRIDIDAPVFIYYIEQSSSQTSAATALLGTMVMCSMKRSTEPLLFE